MKPALNKFTLALGIILIHEKKMKTLIRGIAAGVAFLAMLAAQAAAAPPSTSDTNTQLAELYKLQAAFHRAATVHDPVNGDSAAVTDQGIPVIDQRIKDMLSLWTADATLALIVGFDANGNPIYNYYIGRGDLDTNCPAPSTDPNNRGTICTFFKHVSGSFQPDHKWVELGPAYKTSFDIHGNTATVYFECWYFDASKYDPTSKLPILTLMSHPTAQGTATKVDGVWLLSFITGPPAELPAP